eukprot:c7471_g1_i2.p2 GENE.c7471_g1_i2~~c7471_g1_i2.p2  ORF type:complete len:167 (-),score=25.79 c7471_g1_i2:168-668(-)
MFGSGAMSLLQLKLDWTKDIPRIELGPTLNVNGILDLKSKLPKDRSCFNLFRFVHAAPASNTKTEKTFLFLWAPPDAPVKEKTLCASVKRALVQTLNSVTPVHKQFDLDDTQELSDVLLMSLLYGAPPEVPSEGPAARRPVAARPSRSRKGGRRVIGTKNPLPATF